MAAVYDWSPWGQIAIVTPLAPGIQCVTTPRHGGIWLDAEHRRRVPDYMLPASHGGAGVWWEEDCAFSIPLVVFEDEVRAGGNEAAVSAIDSSLPRDSMRNWFPDIYERHFGVTLKPGESYIRDKPRYL